MTKSPSSKLELEMFEYTITLANYTREIQQVDQAFTYLAAICKFIDDHADILKKV